MYRWRPGVPGYTDPHSHADADPDPNTYAHEDADHHTHAPARDDDHLSGYVR